MKSLKKFFRIQDLIINIKKRKFLYIIIGILPLIVIYFLLSGKEKGSLPTYTIKKSDFIISITESGELKAASNFTLVAPRIWGKLRIVRLAPEGTTVKEGDMLIQFDQTEMLKSLNDKKNELNVQESEIKKLKADQEANMARLEADVDNARITFELSKLNVERMKFESESQQKQAQLELERNKNNYDGSKQKIISQKIINQSDVNKLYIRQKQIRSDIEKVQKDMDALVVKAPLPGLVVYEYNWQTGKKISIGDEPWPGGALISLPDLSKVQVLTMVNEIDVSKVKKDQKVKVKLDAFPDKSFTGKVNSVATIGKNKDDNSSVKVFDVVVDVDDVDPVFKPGMTTSNEIITEVVKNAVSIPLEAVFEKDTMVIVYKMEGSSPIPCEVKLGKKNSDFVIIESGLNAGDVVSLRDPNIETTDDASEKKAPEIKNQPVRKQENAVRIMVR